MGRVCILIPEDAVKKLLYTNVVIVLNIPLLLVCRLCLVQNIIMQ